MKWYSDGKNDVWFFGGRLSGQPFKNYKKERRILRIIVDCCYKEKYDPFPVMDFFCISDMAKLISDGLHTGYFYGEGKFLNDAKDFGVLVPRENDWDIIAFHWLIDVYLTARYDLEMSYLEIARKYPVKDVYNSFSPLHETSETNALSKMCFKESDLFGCIINGKFYMYRHEVPEKERWLLDFEDKADVRMGMIFMSTVFFYKADEPNGYLSNFYPSVFTIDNKTFNCVEQYFMWRKAMMFGDTEIAEQIMKETKPAKIKALGRRVRGYQDSRWAAERYSVMQEGVFAKFSQNEELKQKLLGTSGNFAECSKNDHVWGIGLGIDDPKRIDQKQWNGQNLLGSILGSVYRELK